MSRELTSPFGQNKRKQSLKEKRQSSTLHKTSRWLVGILLVTTVSLSAILWQKEKLNHWWQDLWGPAEYEVINPEIIDTQLIKLTENLHRPSDVIASVKELTASLQGTYGVYIRPLKTDEGYGLNQAEIFTAASVNKLLIMAKALQEVEKGTISLEDTYRLQAKDIQDYGTGSMRYDSLGTVYTYDQLLRLSGKQSDNTAAWVLSLILGQKEVEQFIDDFGMAESSLADNLTTPQEMGEFLAQIYEGEILGSPYQEKFYSYLTKTDFEERIPAGLPSYVTVAHKIGNEIQIVNDCGLVFAEQNPYVICLLSKGVSEAEALKVLPQISHLVWTFESSRRL